jgi:hypothetical protein
LLVADEANPMLLTSPNTVANNAIAVRTGVLRRMTRSTTSADSASARYHRERSHFKHKRPDDCQDRPA